MNKTHWKKTFNKEYLGSHDLEEKQELKLIISNVIVKSVKDQTGGTSNCNIAIFQGNTKPMILNVGACKVIKSFTGSNFIEDWVNVPIQVYIKEVKAFGELVEALRIRDRQPQMTKDKLTPESPAWNKALTTMKEKGDKGMEAILKYFDVSPEHKEVLKSAISPS